VVETCLKWANDAGRDAGVWGGQSEDERLSIKRRDARIRRATALISA
jgi:WhiB family redox-sensing transcriptional regulator